MRGSIKQLNKMIDDQKDVQLELISSDVKKKNARKPTSTTVSKDEAETNAAAPSLKPKPGTYVFFFWVKESFM